MKLWNKGINCLIIIATGAFLINFFPFSNRMQFRSFYFINFSRKHTHVFDDDNDYFCSTNPWLTLEERDEEKKKEEEFFNKKNESRRNKKISLKIMGTSI